MAKVFDLVTRRITLCLTTVAFGCMETQTRNTTQMILKTSVNLGFHTQNHIQTDFATSQTVTGSFRNARGQTRSRLPLNNSKVPLANCKTMDGRFQRSS